MSSRMEDDNADVPTCPECGEVAEWRDIEGHPEGGEYFCPLGCVVDEVSPPADDPFACPDCKAHMRRIGLDDYRCTGCGQDWQDFGGGDE